MKLDAGMALFQRGPFGLRLLHPVLAEAALAGGDGLLDAPPAARSWSPPPVLIDLASRAGGASREGDLLLDHAQAGRDVDDRGADP